MRWVYYFDHTLALGVDPEEDGVLPYMLAMLAALSIFRNSGLMDIVMSGLSWTLALAGVSKEVIDAIPVALMRPFSAGGSRGFMLDAMKTYGADSVQGILSSLFQGAAETTFYVVALYYGSVNVKDSRYTLGIMLLADLVCVITAVFVVRLYFQGSSLFIDRIPAPTLCNLTDHLGNACPEHSLIVAEGSRSCATFTPT